MSLVKIDLGDRAYQIEIGNDVDIVQSLASANICA
jgi:3-dehydroquinate synthase